MTDLRLSRILLSAVAAFAFGATGFAHGIKNDTHHATIEFQRGQDQLTEAAKTQLNTLIDAAKQAGQIATVEVAVWSDQASPAENTSLTEMDRDLANNRGDEIQSYLKDDLQISNVETFNMAENSNWLAKAFNTRSAELKSVFAKNAAPSMTRQDFNVIKTDGAPSKAVVVVTLENKMGTGNVDTNVNKGLAPY